MSRFKELNRIDDAIKNANKAELEWADSYCRMRLQIATLKDHQKFWRNLQRDVSKALAAVT